MMINGWGLGKGNAVMVMVIMSLLCTKYITTLSKCLHRIHSIHYLLMTPSLWNVNSLAFRNRVIFTNFGSEAFWWVQFDVMLVFGMVVWQVQAAPHAADVQPLQGTADTGQGQGERYACWMCHSLWQGEVQFFHIWWTCVRVRVSMGIYRMCMHTP